MVDIGGCMRPRSYKKNPDIPILNQYPKVCQTKPIPTYIIAYSTLLWCYLIEKVLQKLTLRGFKQCS